MECQRVAKLPEGDDWLYEPKRDGYRIIAVIDASTPTVGETNQLCSVRTLKDPR